MQLAGVFTVSEVRGWIQGLLLSTSALECTVILISPQLSLTVSKMESYSLYIALLLFFTRALWLLVKRTEMVASQMARVLVKSSALYRVLFGMQALSHDGLSGCT
jgi:hypothetical protein